MTEKEIEEKFTEVDRRLDDLADSMGEFRRQQEANTASISSLQTMTSELLDIARLHQQALRVSYANAERDRTDIRQLQEEARNILQYLFNQQRNGNGGGAGES